MGLSANALSPYLASLLSHAFGVWRTGMSSSKTIETNEVLFDAVRQFVVRPDRRYQIRLHNNCLYFKTTGSQFDRSWLTQGLQAGAASKVLPPWIQARLVQLAGGSRRTLIQTGIGLLAGSTLLLVLVTWGTAASDASRIAATKATRQRLVVLPVLFMLLVAGFVFSIVGFLAEGPTDRKTAHPHNFRLPLSAIAKARLVKGEGGIQAQLRAGGGQVALLEIHPTTGKPVNLAIPTAADLNTLERHLLSRLGARVVNN